MDEAVCPECGARFPTPNPTQIQEHHEQKQEIICGNCGKSSTAKQWRDGKPAAVKETETAREEAKEEERTLAHPKR